MEFITSTANCIICCAGLLLTLAGYIVKVIKE